MIETYSSGSKIILAIIFAVLFYIVLRYIFKLLELLYVIKHKKPLYTHSYLLKRKLNASQKAILKKDFSFYNKLSKPYKSYFEHRLASFIEDKDFIGRQGVKVSEEMKVLISATAVMLTFGFRDFYIGLISKIVIYPSEFYSKTNDAYHKGEFNPKLKALVLSWEDFKKGFEDGHDNINLGIHEFTHAIHLNSIKERDISSTIFSDSFNELSKTLAHNESLKNELITSNYFRKYAFTNRFEFLAVAIENFIETPKEFKSQFPQIYKVIKQMLNFNFTGY
ncbi:zinc-dependent peptidase [Seonamhaeicola sp.]|uniref:zinc-dependent peptidase n=1 Tax=unclassified Seonamhaeicola TaxID=2622645 RepID=UPI00356325DF